MRYDVNFTKRAEKSYDKNIAYLKKDWGNATVVQFMDRVDELVENIAQNPFTYSFYSRARKIRKCVVNERIILFYRISAKTKVSVLLFWNTYQSPSKLKL